ncbi:MAG: 6-carboxytetrahydropterin synthase [Bacteriovoracaceae bacterium]|nr:6-carboxytetrahydropterin synthase [Bacteriovoracaceae bacterium]
METTLFYENITILDYAYLDPSNGIPCGASLVVDVKIDGPIAFDGMIMDFGKVKPHLKRIIDEYCDHKLCLTTDQWKLLKDISSEQRTLAFKLIEYTAPSDLFYPIGQENHSLKDMEISLSELLQKYVEQKDLSFRVTLREEFSEKKIKEESIPFFRYTHGLKLHKGNCQRLLHGHSNTLKVWVNDELRNDLALKLTNDLFSQNIHFAFQENIVSDKNSVIEIAYESSQGKFHLKIPAKYVYVLPCESTIEKLSQHFAQVIKNEYGQKNDLVTVAAFEGIGKGAISRI